MGWNRQCDLNPCEIREIVDRHMVDILLTWAKLYQANGKAFIGSILKYNSLKYTMAFIVKAAKNQGIFAECKGDFSEYVGKLKIEDRWRRPLNELLILIKNVIYERK